MSARGIRTFASDQGVDVVIVGAGPAGLSAALNLARALVNVVIVDARRPRNAATLRSHGFLTRDGISPVELRTLARQELRAYPQVHYRNNSTVTDIREAGSGFDVDIITRPTEAPDAVHTRRVLITTGLSETLPNVPHLRSFYGMSIFSCVACDAWDLRGKRLALIGETPDLARRALHLSRWSTSLTVMTNGLPTISRDEETALAARGIRVERSEIRDLVGAHGVIERVVLTDGRSVPPRRRVRSTGVAREP